MNTQLLRVIKLLVGLLGGSAIVTEIAVLIERQAFVPANFFSFFTIQSNLLCVVVCIFGAVFYERLKTHSGFQYLRLASTLYISITGVVFSVLLSGLDSIIFTAVPWDNIVLHYIIPVAAVLDWLLDPPGHRLTLKRTWPIILLPLLYLVYSLIRGHYTGWYPYPFLDPANHGFVGIALVSLCITLGALAGLAALVRIAQRHPLWR